MHTQMQLIVALFRMHDAKAESSLLMSPGMLGGGDLHKQKRCNRQQVKNHRRQSGKNELLID